MLWGALPILSLLSGYFCTCELLPVPAFEINQPKKLRNTAERLIKRTCEADRSVLDSIFSDF